MDAFDDQSSVTSVISDAVSTALKFLLTAAEKLMIGQRIVTGEETTKEAHKAHNLTMRTMQRYAKSVREGKVLYRESGRPRKIDDEGFDNICDQAILCGDLSEADIKYFINCEYENTYRRRHHIDDDDDVELAPLSRATYYRYMSEVKRRLGEENIEIEE